MRKNGFTLIELLAVIVILAIIALIATPIILGIINDAREKANERSVELYAAAVKNGIAAYQLTGLNAPKSFSDLTIQYDGDVKCTVQELYEDGSFYLEGCKVNNGDKEYSYGTKQIVKGTMSICKPVEEQLYASNPLDDGYKYECDVDPNKEGYDYIFYVLNVTSTEVNLIMDSNINISGEAVKSDDMEDKGFVAWYADAQDTSYGPITAMNHLQTATVGWTNTNQLTINKFTSCDHDNICADIPMTEYVVNARMPYYSEAEDSNELNDYLYEYLDGSEWYVSGEPPTNNVSNVGGYWTLSSDDSFYGTAWRVDSRGFAFDGGVYVNYDGSYGVRPVINLSI